MVDGLESAFVHDSATVESAVLLGAGTKIWHQAQVRTRAIIGKRCIIGKGVFIDFDVVIGDDCKLQNYACVYHGVTLGRGVFVGPHAVFTNDMRPRAVTPEFGPLRDGDWTVGETTVGDGAAIGANSTILPNVTIGKWAMVAAGSVVASNVLNYSLVVGNPARHRAWLCPCGLKVDSAKCVRCGDLPDDHPLSA
jgi:UDP-2-acetamido-3-amino-2,3-dideoxy-glucuronate N-acetyltransferase